MKEILALTSELGIQERLETCQHEYIIHIHGKCLHTEKTTSGFGGVIEKHELIIVMDLCPGDMRVFLESPQPLSASLISRWLRQVSSGMHYLHDVMQIYHGDLKPENILITADHDCRLSDFGMSVDCHEMTSTVKTHMAKGGTLPYKAPELFRHEKLSKKEQLKADVYSFSIIVVDILYRLGNSSSYLDENWRDHHVCSAIVLDKRRPVLHNEIPLLYRFMVSWSWEPDPANRPSFKQLLSCMDLSAYAGRELETWVSRLSNIRQSSKSLAFLLKTATSSRNLFQDHEADSQAIKKLKQSLMGISYQEQCAQLNPRNNGEVKFRLAPNSGLEQIATDRSPSSLSSDQPHDEMSDGLAGAYNTFLQDCIEITDLLGEKKRILISIDATFGYSADVEIMQLEEMRRRRHQRRNLLSDIQMLRLRVDALDECASSLTRKLKEHTGIIQQKRNDVNTVWNELLTAAMASEEQLCKMLKQLC